jgi:YVTN family beta-propeller protein
MHRLRSKAATSRAVSCADVAGLLVLTAITVMRTVPSAADVGPVAYVTHSATGAVTAISTASQRVAATIPLALGDYLQDMKLSPDGTRLYVAGPYGISVVDTVSAAVVGTIQDMLEPAGCEPGGCGFGSLDVTPDGAFLYVTTVAQYPALGYHTVTVIDTATRHIAASVPVPARPHGVAIAANGRAYVTTLEVPYGVTVIDTATQTVAATVTLDVPSGAVVASADGTRVYVSTWDMQGSYVEVVDTRTNSVSARIPVPYYAGGLTLTPDGRSLYVVSTVGTISVIDVATNRVVATVHGAHYPQQAVISPDGALAYVSEYDRQDILVIDTATATVAGSIPVNTYPANLALSRDGGRLYVGNPNSSEAIQIVDTDTRRVTAVVPGYYQLDSIALRPDGRFAYVANALYGSAAILVIDTAAHERVAAISLEGAGLNIAYGQTQLALSSDGSALYVATNPIAVIDTATSQIADTIALPIVYGPVAIALAPDGKRAYALGVSMDDSQPAWSFDNTVFVIDTETRTVSARVVVTPSGTPADIAVTPDGKFAYVSLQRPPEPEHGPPIPGHLVVLDTATNNVIASFSGSPHRVVFSPDGRFAYVATDTGAAMVIDTASVAIAASVDLGTPQGSIAVTPDGAFAYATGADWTIPIIRTADNEVVGRLYAGPFPGDIAIGRDPGVACPGDCNADGRVTIDEITVGVAITLNRAAFERCPRMGMDGSHTVTVVGLVRAINAALHGCGS